MKANDLRNKTKVELLVMLTDLSVEKFNLKMQKGTGQLSKPDQIKKDRREIARIHTLISEMTRLHNV